MADPVTPDSIAPAAPAAPVDPVDALIPAETATISEHAAVFGPVSPSLDAEAKAKTEDVRQKIRHRARSQQASPEDVPRIAKLTKQLREAEAERDALKARAIQSPPVREDHQRGPAASASAAEGGASRQAASLIPETRLKPTEDAIGTTYETYAAFVEDLADWKQEQREARWLQGEQQRQQQAWATQADQAWQTAHQQYAERAEAFAAVTPDFKELLAAQGQSMIPPAAVQAILQDDKGPAFVYHLLSHPDQHAEMVFLMDGKPPTTENVALATRWLSSRVQAAATGSAAPTPPTIVASRPPNPVRTGPMRIDTPPSDDSSIADHAKVFGQSRSRGR